MNSWSSSVCVEGESSLVSICREEPVCLKCSEGLVTVNVGVRPSVLRGEPVNENSREEPVSLAIDAGTITALAHAVRTQGLGGS